MEKRTNEVSVFKTRAELFLLNKQLKNSGSSELLIELIECNGGIFDNAISFTLSDIEFSFKDIPELAEDKQTIINFFKF